MWIERLGDAVRRRTICTFWPKDIRLRECVNIIDTQKGYGFQGGQTRRYSVGRYSAL